MQLRADVMQQTKFMFVVQGDCQVFVCARHSRLFELFISELYLAAQRAIGEAAFDSPG